MTHNVKPLPGYRKKVKVHAIELEGIADNGNPYARTFCSRDAVDWNKTNEKLSCVVCLRRMSKRVDS